MGKLDPPPIATLGTGLVTLAATCIDIDVGEEPAKGRPAPPIDKAATPRPLAPRDSIARNLKVYGNMRSQLTGMVNGQHWRSCGARNRTDVRDFQSPQDLQCNVARDQRPFASHMVIDAVPQNYLIPIDIRNFLSYLNP